MNILRCLSLLSALLAFVLPAASASPAPERPKVVAYVPNWINLEEFAGRIDYAKLTHINLAFENPAGPEGELTFNPKNAALIAKARANGVKILLSIGGGSAATDPVLQRRYFDLLGDARRAAFVAGIAAYLERHQFDGLDVDIEGPSINQDYGRFIRDLAAPLKAKGRLLTAALSKGYGGDKVPDSVFAHFDFINLMAYDATGPWAPNAPGPHSSFAFATNNVQYWLQRGLPRSKAVLGVPFYGHAFGQAAGRGGHSYARIVAAYPGAENRDEAGSTIYYNGMPTIAAKCRYATAEKLAGIMIWSLDNDAPGERSLLAVIHRTLSPGAARD